VAEDQTFFYHVLSGFRQFLEQNADSEEDDPHEPVVVGERSQEVDLYQRHQQSEVEAGIERSIFYFVACAKF
jgi:hypothetical protein